MNWFQRHGWCTFFLMYIPLGIVESVAFQTFPPQYRNRVWIIFMAELLAAIWGCWCSARSTGQSWK